MKVYVAHSTSYDFRGELYDPIKCSELFKEHEIIFPHDDPNMMFFSRDLLKQIDLIVAECSYPSTGLGIELGWAFDDNIPIYCIYKKGFGISSSIKMITDNIFEYDNANEMVNVLTSIVTHM